MTESNVSALNLSRERRAATASGYLMLFILLFALHPDKSTRGTRAAGGEQGAHDYAGADLGDPDALVDTNLRATLGLSRIEASHRHVVFPCLLVPG